MSIPAAITETEQKATIRRRMATQRLLIAERLRASDVPAQHYPRSFTMRVLTEHPRVTAGLFAGVTVLLLKWRVIQPDSLFATALRITRLFLNRPG